MSGDRLVPTWKPDSVQGRTGSNLETGHCPGTDCIRFGNRTMSTHRLVPTRKPDSVEGRTASDLETGLCPETNWADLETGLVPT